MAHKRITRIWSCCLLALASCNRAEPSGTANRSVTVGDRQQSQERLRAYPPGRWRLDTSQIGDVVLWVSHILIRHDRAASLDPCFSLAYWQPEQPAVSRHRSEALTLAKELANQAQHAPDQFDQLARKYSEDSCSKANGGSLGGISASHLQPFPEVLDALAATAVGSVSEVVETRYGFHLFLRRAPPPEQVVSGAHIVIGYDQAGWLRYVGRGDPHPRSRSDALELANELYDQAASAPSEFTRLVDHHSEHSDAVRAGDLGTWSTREPTSFPREVEILSRLRVGDVAPPLDSPVGFEILQRTANRTRTTYAVEQVRLGFNPAVGVAQPGSQANVLQSVRSMALQLQDSPSTFEVFQQQYECAGVEQWQDGRGFPALSNALDQLAIGEIGKEPFLFQNSYAILRRVQPSLATHSPLYELPEPATPNIAFALARRGSNSAREELAAVVDQTTTKLGLEGETAAAFAQLHREGAMLDDGMSFEAKIAAYESFQQRVQKLLGPDRYGKYQGLLNGHFERLLLGASG